MSAVVAWLSSDPGMTVGMDGDVPRLRATPDELRTLFESTIRGLRPANRHHEFERLCVQHARRRFDPTLVVSGGPVSAGGDVGMDGYSSWVALDDAANSVAFWFVPSGWMTTVVACTTTISEKLSRKLRSDVGKIIAGDLPCGRILFYSAESLSEGQWKKACDKIEIPGVELYYRRPESFATTMCQPQPSSSNRAVELVIIDGMKLADDLGRSVFAALAVDCLRLPRALLPMQRDLSQIHAVVRSRACTAMGGLFRNDVADLSLLEFTSELDTVLGQALSREGLAEQFDELRALVEDVGYGWPKLLPVDIRDPEHYAAQRQTDSAIRGAWSDAAHAFDDQFGDLATFVSTGRKPARQPDWARECSNVIASLLGACAVAESALRGAAETSGLSSRRIALAHARRRLYAVEDAARVVERRLKVEASGVLLIEGGWGTGKSYHAARAAVARIDCGAPTMFVDGSNWPVSDGPWLTELAKSIDSGISGEEFLDAWRLHADVTGQQAVIIVDAVNEASSAHWEFRLNELAGRVSPYPEITLIATRRNDHESGPVVAAQPHQWGFYHHNGVDPAHAWEVLRRYFALPPVIAPWTLPDYRKPLVLRMFARVCLNESDQSATPMAVGELFDAWIRVLSTDFAHQRDRSAPQPYDHGELRAVLAHLDDNLGHGVTREAIRRDAASLSSPEINRAIDFLCYEGVLTESQGRLRYGLQRIEEFRQAQRLLDAGHRWTPTTARTRYRQKKWINPDEITIAIAEIAPTHLGHDALSVNTRTWRAGMPEAFILSLQNRSPSTVGESTIKTTRRLLQRRVWTIAIWVVAFQNSVIPGHPIGAGFIDREVASMTRADRAQHWAQPLQAIMALGAEEDDSEMAELLLWIDSQARRKALSPGHLDELARMLMWCLTLPPGNASASVARTLTAVLLARPQAAVDILSLAYAQHDLDIYCGVWNALYGAIARAGSTSASIELANAAREHFHNHHGSTQGLPTHLRLHTAVYRALKVADKAHGQHSPRPALHEFLFQHAAPFKVRWIHRARLRVRAIPTAAGEGMFRTYQGDLAHAYMCFNALQGSGLDVSLRRAVQVMGEVAARYGVCGFGRQLIRQRSKLLQSKILDQAKQIWLAELALTNPYADEFYGERGGYVPHASGSGRWILPSDSLDELCDTTVSLDAPLCVEPIDRTDAASIPVELKVLKGYDSDLGIPCIESTNFCFAESDGTQWWVLAGDFEIEHRRDLPLSLGRLLGESPQMGPDLLLGRGARHRFLIRIRTWLVHTDADIPDVFPLSSDDFAAAEWGSLAEVLTCAAPGNDPAVVPTSYVYQNPPPQKDHFICLVPTAQFRAALDLEWTGRDVTCVDKHGNVLKGVATPGSYQLPYIVASDGLRQRAGALGYRLVWELTVIDHHDAPDADSKRRCHLNPDE
ncbi:hypothetical protein [Nocardia nepalensis]|uniref:hypothetical protein n=1 Tax=Nocardia nepalensis TaxID=3375448 RepID=UPI003B67C797